MIRGGLPPPLLTSVSNQTYCRAVHRLLCHTSFVCWICFLPADKEQITAGSEEKLK